MSSVTVSEIENNRKSKHQWMIWSAICLVKRIYEE